MKLRAAIRDPKTRKIYAGESHAHILDDLEDSNWAVFKRIQKVYCDSGNCAEAENVGFIEMDGSFLTRKESLKKWGVYQSQDIGRSIARRGL